MVWYSHLLKNFLQFVVIHTVKDFSIANETEVVVFLEFSCFFSKYYLAKKFMWVFPYPVLAVAS